VESGEWKVERNDKSGMVRNAKRHTERFPTTLEREPRNEGSTLAGNQINDHASREGARAETQTTRDR